MKKVDEMDRDIKLRATEVGFFVAVLMLALWVLFELFGVLFSGGDYNVLPGLVLILTLSIKKFCEAGLKRQMIAGDEEYKEPNRPLRMIILGVAVLILLFSVGFYLGSLVK